MKLSQIVQDKLRELGAFGLVYVKNDTVLCSCQIDELFCDCTEDIPDCVPATVIYCAPCKYNGQCKLQKQDTEFCFIEMVKENNHETVS